MSSSFKSPMLLDASKIISNYYYLCSSDRVKHVLNIDREGANTKDEKEKKTSEEEKKNLPKRKKKKKIISQPDSVTQLDGK